MSELTTEKAIGIIADDLCFETGGIDEPHTNGCAQEAVAKAWLAQVKREAKVEALREAADELNTRANENELIARADRYEGFYAGVRASLQNEESYLRARADRIEAWEVKRCGQCGCDLRYPTAVHVVDCCPGRSKSNE